MAEIRCPACGRPNRAEARYCAACGVNLGDAAPKDAQGRPRYQPVAPTSLRQRLIARLRRIRPRGTRL